MSPKKQRRLKKLTRPVRYGLMVVLAECLRLLMGVLPQRVVVGLGRRVGWVLGRMMPRSRYRAARHLWRRGVARDRHEALAMADEVFRSVGMTALEFLHSLRWPLDRFAQQVAMSDYSEVESTLESGRGVIFVTAHMGNWELLPRTWRAYSGRELAAVMTPQNFGPLNRWIMRQRARHGIEVINNSGDPRPILRCLKQGRIVGMLVDQDTRRFKGHFVDFFGCPALTPVGPAVLAQRIGSPILVGVLVRDATDPCHHRFELSKLIWPDSDAEPQSDIERMTERYTQELERMIRRAPTQWVWFHRRWRRRPGQTIRLARRRS